MTNSMVKDNTWTTGSPPFNGPAMPVIDGTTETEVLVHSFNANEIKDGLIALKFK